jgi:hypothetical protein
VAILPPIVLSVLNFEMFLPNVLMLSFFPIGWGGAAIFFEFPLLLTDKQKLSSFLFSCLLMAKIHSMLKIIQTLFSRLLGCFDVGFLFRSWKKFIFEFIPNQFC